MNLIFSDRALSRIPEQAKVTGFSGSTYYKVIKGFYLNSNSLPLHWFYKKLTINIRTEVIPRFDKELYDTKDK